MSAKSSGETEYTHKYMEKVLEDIGKKRFLEIMNSMMGKAFDDSPNYRFPFPVLLILGKKDKTGNIIKSMTNWPKKDKNGVLKTVPNAGHNANMDSPEFVNQFILDYLEK
ncbi:alpha/beta hydrolase [Virgibacillus sp. NKC19-3]|uniref:alpha/beta fold hydrolase n=1 Tax=Virgibacillus saliphilus TaxID=2831674 RepID=UPI001C9A7B2A|nr:alpha/beta hydrolase [Virgibacillus sp. NKC19-3]MBY7141868.1 alpha/beta hydrolase [Virgibacillus sp. NKC19-3]